MSVLSIVPLAFSPSLNNSAWLQKRHARLKCRLGGDGSFKPASVKSQSLVIVSEADDGPPFEFCMLSQCFVGIYREGVGNHFQQG